jgi:hypothetical protein
MTKKIVDVEYRVDVQVYGESRWANNALTFPNIEAAEAYAADLFQRWTGMRGWRVVSIDTPTRQEITA